MLTVPTVTKGLIRRLPQSSFSFPFMKSIDPSCFALLGRTIGVVSNNLPQTQEMQHVNECYITHKWVFKPYKNWEHT
jgi:hypothetical protein